MTQAACDLAPVTIIKKSTVLLAAFALAVALSRPALAQEDEAARAERWKTLAGEIFAGKPVQSGEGKIALEAPERAYDAALVPVTVSVQNPQDVKGIYLVIDNNPAPLAAHVTFGPAADPRLMKFRVRVDQYTYMHAIEETDSGALYEAHRFVKASGGCSAPSGSYDEAALAAIGEMRLRDSGPPGDGQPRQVQLSIRHPNFSGMQRDPVSQGYTPPRFLRTVDLTFGGETVLHLDSDISLSADPAITFALKPQGKGKLGIIAQDSDNALFERSFELGGQGS
jgi:sulfur-oxidizing protein SoxY